jgi:hypothetical protein
MPKEKHKKKKYGKEIKALPADINRPKRPKIVKTETPETPKPNE